jgi:transposase-like protein
MKRIRTKPRNVSVPERAQIIQRVLVDGWKPDRVAHAFGVSERQVARWLAAYRRDGMASLRGDPITATTALRRWMQRVSAAYARLMHQLTGEPHRAIAAPCVELRPTQRRNQR